MLGLVTLGLAAHDAVRAAQDLQAARSVLVALRDAPADVTRARDQAARAHSFTVRARTRLSSIPVRVVSAVPVLGRSLSAERAVARASASTVAGSLVVLDVVPQVRTPRGVDASALRSLARELEPVVGAAEQDLRALKETSTDATPRLVGEAVRDARKALGEAVSGLRQAQRGSAVAASVLGADRPRTILVALENNAELRGTGGYVSTFATGVVDRGRLRLDPFRDVEGIGHPPATARKVPAPAEYVEDFGPFLADTTLWREWTMSPDIPHSASVAANAAEVLLGQRPDIVLLVDVPALSALVALGGKDIVLPDGSQVTADALTEALLADTYAAAGKDLADQVQRRAELRAAAGATATELLAGDLPPLPLVRELGRLTKGRHMALWSADAAEQQALEELGVAGSADPQGDDLALVSVNNLNANKLDYYVDRAVEVKATVHQDRVEVHQRLVLDNRAPDDLVPYVAGQRDGTVVERVEFSIARNAVFGSLRRDGAPTNGDVRRGGERTRVHTYIELARGGQTVIDLRYSLPVVDGSYGLRLLPQALARDAQLEVVLQPGPGVRFAGAEEGRRDADVVRRAGPWAVEERMSVQVRRAG